MSNSRAESASPTYRPGQGVERLKKLVGRGEVYSTGGGFYAYQVKAGRSGFIAADDNGSVMVWRVPVRDLEKVYVMDNGPLHREPDYDGTAEGAARFVRSRKSSSKRRIV